MKYLEVSGSITPVTFFVTKSKDFSNPYRSRYTEVLSMLVKAPNLPTSIEVFGISVTRSQLEQIRDEIDSYLRKTAEGNKKLEITDDLIKLEVRPELINIEPQPKIKPELIKIEQNPDKTVPKLWQASIDDWHNLTDNRAGYIYLYGLGDSGEKAKAALNTQFEALILQFVDTNTTDSKTLSATLTNNVGKPDNTPIPESKKTEPQKTERNSQVFKLNPNRVASRKNHLIQGYGQ